MMKVLEVIRQGQIGGGESHLLDLIAYLDKSRIEPVCLSFTGGEMIRRLQAAGIKCHIVETSKPFDIKIQKQIKQLIQNEHIQLVHAHGSRAASNVLWPTKSLHLPLIYTVHGWSFHNDQSAIIKNLRALSEKVICHYCNEVICVSKSNANTGKDAFGLQGAHVIENGINMKRFNPEAKLKDLRPTMNFDGNDFVVGFIARCTKQKGPIVFLQSLEMAHKKNPLIKGLFVGEGEMDAEVDAFISEHHMESYLYRSPFRTDVPELLHAIDAYCLPSQWEGLSIALLEAMAMKKTIIATPTDGTSELIRHEENGLIVPFNDVQGLADAMLNMVNIPEKCKQFGCAARLLVEKKFNAQRVADDVMNIYEKYSQTLSTQ